METETEPKQDNGWRVLLCPKCNCNKFVIVQIKQSPPPVEIQIYCQTCGSVFNWTPLEPKKMETKQSLMYLG